MNMLVLFLTSYCYATAVKSEELNFDGGKVIRTYPRTEDDVKALSSIRTQYDFWTEPAANLSTDIRVTQNARDKLTEFLNLNKIRHEVTITDLGVLLQAEKKLSFKSRREGNLDWKDYESYDSIQQWLVKIANTHNNICELISIGKSFEKRDLKVVWIRKKAARNVTKKALWLDGGMHAREWISPAIVTWVIKELLTNKAKYNYLLNKLDIYILPLVNPDGYEYSRAKNRLWRKTRSINPGTSCVGVDPNRNFGYKFGGLGASANPCHETYRGKKAFSEVELRSMRNFILNRKQAAWQIYVTVHSYSQMILTPWGYNRSVPTDYAELEKLGKEAALAVKAVHGRFYQVGGAAALLGPGAGGSDDWAKGAAGFKYSYTIETRDHRNGRFGFILPKNQIIPTCQEVFAAFIIFAKGII